MKSFIVNQVKDGERLNILISCISEYNSFMSLQVKQNQIKLLIIISEVFQHQILEYFPKIFKILNSTLTKEMDQDMFVAIGETYAGLLENSLKNTNESDSVFVLEEAFKSLFLITKQFGTKAQAGSAITISKIIHGSPSAYFHKLFDVIISNILEYLKPESCKSPFEMLECLLSICLTSQNQVPPYLDVVLEVLNKYLGHSNPKVRKISIDNIYSLSVTCPFDMKEYVIQLVESINIMKTDKNSNVRKAAMAALGALKELGAEELAVEAAKKKELAKSAASKKVMERKKRTRTPSSISRAKGVGVKVDKGSFSKKRKKTKQYGIDKRKINPAFMKQTGIANDPGVQIYVNNNQKVVNVPSPQALQKTYDENKESDREPEIFETPKEVPSMVEVVTPQAQITKEELEYIQDQAPDILIQNEIHEKEPSPPHFHQQTFKENVTPVRIEPSPQELIKTEPDSTSRLSDFRALRMSRKHNHSVINDLEFQEPRDKSPNYGLNPELEQKLIINEMKIRELSRSSRKRKEDRMRNSREVGVDSFQVSPSKRRERYIDQIGTRVSNYQKNRKEMKRNKEEERKMKKYCDELKKEISGQNKTINEQKQQIDGLVKHVQNLTNHVNILLNKVGIMEQSIFTLNSQRLVQPSPMLMGHGNPYQAQSQPQTVMFAQPGMGLQGQNAMLYQPDQSHLLASPYSSQKTGHVRSERKKKKSKWKQRRERGKDRDSEKEKEKQYERERERKRRERKRRKEVKEEMKKDRERRQKEYERNNNGEMELEREREDREGTSSESESEEESEVHNNSHHKISQGRVNRTLNHELHEADINTNEEESEYAEEEEEEAEEEIEIHLGSFGNGEPRAPESEEDDDDLDLRPDPEAPGLGADQYINDGIDLNHQVHDALRLDNDQAILEVLENFDNIHKFLTLRETNLINLLEKITQMVEMKAYSRIDSCIPWISRFIEFRKIGSVPEAKALRRALTKALKTDSKRIIFSQNIHLETRQFLDKIEHIIKELS